MRQLKHIGFFLYPEYQLFQGPMSNLASLSLLALWISKMAAKHRQKD